MIVRKALYRLYVFALLGVVFWAGQLFYSLIYWEFDVIEPVPKAVVSEKDSGIGRLINLRRKLTDATIKMYSLGDVIIAEQYEPGHFHHVGGMLDSPILNSCDYCHTNIAHSKGEEVRAFRNMHNQFMACETCHFSEHNKSDGLAYGWLDVVTKQAAVRPVQLSLTQPPVAREDSDGAIEVRKIIPWLVSKSGTQSLIERSDMGSVRQLLENYGDMTDLEIQSALSRLHRGMSQKPFKCNDCHSKRKSAIAYGKLGYSPEETKKLMDSAVASVVSEYNKFHFPNLFIRKDDRKSNNRRVP